MKTSLKNTRHAFTLVELLVVIAIIGVLAALLLPAVFGALERAKVARTAGEIAQLQDALEAYKTKYGDYPPDMSSRAIVIRHIQKAFPRISATEFNDVMGIDRPAPMADTAGVLYTDATKISVSTIDPAEVLPFWLGGFSSDPDHPFSGPGGPFIFDSSGNVFMNSARNAPLFEFDEQRLTQAIDSSGDLTSTDEEALHGAASGSNDFFPIYSPQGRPEPYVYFDSRTYSYPDINGDAVRPLYPPSLYSTTTSFQGIAYPYRSDNQIPQTQATARTPWDIYSPTGLPYPFKWANPTTYQIIAAGSDGHYGVASPFKQFPSGNNYATLPKVDDDNITNFSEGKILGDHKDD